MDRQSEQYAETKAIDARPTLARNLNATAAVLLATTIPYSLVFLEPLTQKLEAHARNSAATSTSTTAYDTSDDVQAREEQTVHYLLDRWATFNLGRGVLAGVAAVCAIWAGVGGIRVVGVDVLGSA